MGLHPDVLDFRGPRDPVRSGDAWNRLECICRGNRLEVRLNGQLVNSAFDVVPSAGQILLQCEGSEILFRRLELLPVTARPKTAN